MAGLDARTNAVSGNRISSAILFVCVAIAPLPFGSTDRRLILIWCSLLAVALGLASVKQLLRPQLLPLAGAFLILVAYACVAHEQIALEPWTLVSRPRIWTDAGDYLKLPVAPAITVARDNLLSAVAAPLAFLLAFCVSFIVCTDYVRAKQLLHIIVASGCCYAVLTIAIFFVDPGKVLWRDKIAHGNSLTGPFLNRNTAALYFGSCMIVGALLLIRLFQQTKTDVEPGVLARLKSYSQGQYVFLRSSIRLATLFLATVITLIATLMTRSRAGVFCIIAGCSLAIFLYMGRKGLRDRKFWAVAALFVLTLVIAAQVIGIGIGSRFDESGLTDGGRLGVYQATLNMISDHPWFGIGFGNFEIGFPRYRPDTVSIVGIWNRTHNTLLEIAAEGGLLLAASLVAAWAGLLALLYRGVSRRKRRVIIPAAALGVAVSAVLHSSLDFSLQIPGFSIVVASLIGAGAAQSFSSGRIYDVQPKASRAAQTLV